MDQRYLQFTIYISRAFNMLHIPLLRFGVPYKSVDVATTPHHRTREPFVEISQANVGLISRDLLKQAEARAALERYSVADLIGMCKAAAPDRKSTRLNSSHLVISYAVFC